MVWVGVVWFSEFVCLGTMFYINVRGLQKRSFQKFKMVPVQIYNGWHGQAQQPAIATTKLRTWRLLASPGAVVSSQGVLGKRSSEGVELVWSSCLQKKKWIIFCRFLTLSVVVLVSEFTSWEGFAGEWNLFIGLDFWKFIIVEILSGSCWGNSSIA